MKEYIPKFDEFVNEHTNYNSHDNFISEIELNELKLTSEGIKDLLTAIYYNWDKIKKKLMDQYYFKSFRDVIEYLKDGDRREQIELENFIKSFGIQIIDFDEKGLRNR